MPHDQSPLRYSCLRHSRPPDRGSQLSYLYVTHFGKTITQYVQTMVDSYTGTLGKVGSGSDQHLYRGLTSLSVQGLKLNISNET